MNFIKTSSEETALKLRELKFQELPKEGNFFVFVNNGTQKFDENKTIIKTNRLNF